MQMKTEKAAGKKHDIRYWIPDRIRQRAKGK
jgi:hypothetical protein